jgi:hypothetical protein
MLINKYQPLLIPLNTNLNISNVPGKSISNYNSAIRKLGIFAQSSTFLASMAQKKLDYLLTLTLEQRWSLYLDSFD